VLPVLRLFWRTAPTVRSAAALEVTSATAKVTTPATSVGPRLIRLLEPLTAEMVEACEPETVTVPLSARAGKVVLAPPVNSTAPPARLRPTIVLKKPLVWSLEPAARVMTGLVVVTWPPKRSLFPMRRVAPSATETALEAPKVPERTRVPWLMVVAPVWVAAPEKVQVPAPDFTRETEVPEIACW
jgi:hypothetical protein